jgi:ABC-type bacteriocin/lantibiotic exporter with double-glycine peptidase domain
LIATRDVPIHELPFLAPLPPAARAHAAAQFERCSFAFGETILTQGEPAAAVYVLIAGRARIIAADEGAAERSLGHLEPLDSCGEVALIENAPSAVTVRASTSVVALRLDAGAFQALLARYPAFRSALERRAQPLAAPAEFAADLSHPPGRGPFDDRTADDAEDRELDAPFADPDGRFVKTNGRIRRFPHVAQLDEMDCGAACVAVVARWFGLAASQARVRRLVHTGLDGASLGALCHAAEELGLAARSVKASPRNLEAMPLPAIVHWQGNHWVVLYDVDATHARISDPAAGLRRIPRAELERAWTGYAILLERTAEIDATPGERASWRWLLPFFRPHAGLLARAAVLALLAAALQMALPVFSQVIVDRVLVERDTVLLNLLVAGMIAVIAFMLVATLLQRYLLSFVAVRIDSVTLDFLTRRLLGLPMRYFMTRRTGDIQRRIAGMWQIREFLVEYGVAALAAVTQLAAALTLMLMYSPVLTLVFLATVPLYLLLVRYAATRLYPLYTRLEQAHGAYQSFQIDAIKGIETIKALAGERAFRGLMLREFDSVARPRFRADFLVMSYHAITHATTLVSVALFLMVGARFVMNGSMSIGALVAFNALVALANAPIQMLLAMWDNMQAAAVWLHRLDDVMLQTPEQGEDRTHLVPVRTLEGRVSLRGVGLRYGDAGARAALTDISFDAAPGQHIAIVGRSGSGKTTLIKCLAGLLEPTAGSIRFDGMDLRALNHRDLRRHIGIVLQESHLFDDTISRNVAFGADEPDPDAVRRAIHLANARELVERLPLGYETRVGESGLMLSAGERQRIAIARALYHDPSILIFDEATSALDAESERVLQANMHGVLAHRTAFIIAHRLSTVRRADHILVLDAGRIVERGDHAELMQRQGLYYFLCNQQLGV